MKQRLLKQLETLGSQLGSAKTEHEAMQARLRNDETHSQLTALVKKLGSQEQTVYQLQECTLLTRESNRAMHNTILAVVLVEVHL